MRLCSITHIFSSVCRSVSILKFLYSLYLLAAGNTGHGYSGRNFLLNIIDWNWIELESRIDPYMGHSSGSFYNNEKGKREIVITDRDSSYILDVETNVRINS